MRKMVSLVLLSFLTWGMSSCKEQEATKTYEIDDLVGVWELSSAKIYDREAKFLSDTGAKDEYGCGRLTWVYTADQIEILNYIGKDEMGNCLEERISLTYTLQGNTIHTVDETKVEESMLVVNLTEDELVVMTTLPNNALDEKANAIKYAELTCRRVK